MMLSLFPLLLLLSTRAALKYCAASPTPTFTDTDPITGGRLECDRCPPGTYLRARCTSTKKTECAPCPSGSFTELWNYIGKCLRCGVCGQNQVEKNACTASSDCQCECKQGYYYKMKFDMCLRHSECPAGQEVLTEGTPTEDTVCRTCPNGTFSSTSSTRKNCTEHRSCNASGLHLLLKGSTWHDNLCGTCDAHRSKDGADYLKEIIPAFFVHQKMMARRLRRVVHRLMADGNRRDGFSLTQLHKHIDSWVAAATATQIRQLPAILMKLGANNAGERLERKLQRIDSRLNELCSLENRLDGVVLMEVVNTTM